MALKQCATVKRFSATVWLTACWVCTAVQDWESADAVGSVQMSGHTGSLGKKSVAVLVLERGARWGELSAMGSL